MADLAFRADLKIATQTLAAVNAAVEREAEDGWRLRLGASLIGRPCERSLWYAFRWAQKPEHSGRVLRLFARGQREEDTMAELLRKAGVKVVQVDPATGDQYRFAAVDGHFGGSMDGAVQGLPESREWHVWECKTHGKKSFDELAAKGVKASKPEHYAQIQCYMGWTGMTRALYTAVCKDDDRLYFERVEYDDDEFRRLMNKAARIIDSSNPPERISEDPAWYQCRFCDFQSICHGEDSPSVNCRTCVHATPIQSGAWHCARHSITISEKGQKEGCQSHRYIPSTLNWCRVTDANEADNWIEYRINGTENIFRNCAQPDGFSSEEIAACYDKSALCDALVREIRADMDARIIEGAL